MIIKIYWGNYTFNTRTLQVKRAKPGKGTKKGHVLKPFNGGRITPSINNRKYYTSIDELYAKYA